MRIQNNIMALNTHRQLGINNLNQTKSTEKLSSGFRINRAADDASGLMISEKMRAQIRGLNQASANAQDGISLIQAAEGALQETHSVLQRMRELAVKAANDVNETEDRGAIKAEMDQLTREVDRIAFTTEFNKKTLLDGSLTDGAKSAKTVSGTGVRTGIVATAAAAAGSYGIEVSKLALANSQTYGVALDKSVEGETVILALGGADIKGEDGTVLLKQGSVVTFTASGDIEKDNATAINMMKDALTQAIGKDYNVTSSGSNLKIEAKKAITSANLATVKTATFAATAKKSDGTAGATYAATSISAGTAVTGVSAEVKVNGGTALTMSATKYGEFVDATNGLTFTMDDVTKFSAAVVKVSAGHSLTLQVGANTSVDQTIGISVRSLSAAALGIDNLSVHSNEAGRSAIASVEKAITMVSEQRSALGAVQNRLEHTVANLDTVAENLTAAESRIRDVDMAKEMMNFTKNNILSQAATAMLAQANQAPQTVLQLLR